MCALAGRRSRYFRSVCAARLILCCWCFIGGVTFVSLALMAIAVAAAVKSDRSISGSAFDRKHKEKKTEDQRCRKQNQYYLYHHSIRFTGAAKTISQTIPRVVPSCLPPSGSRLNPHSYHLKVFETGTQQADCVAHCN